MVRVTRLDGSEIVVNADLIETLEATPDTVVTLSTGRRLVVREPVDEVIERVIAYRRRVAGWAVWPGGPAGAAVASGRGRGPEPEAETPGEAGMPGAAGSGEAEAGTAGEPGAEEGEAS